MINCAAHLFYFCTGEKNVCMKVRVMEPMEPFWREVANRGLYIQYVLFFRR